MVGISDFAIYSFIFIVTPDESQGYLGFSTVTLPRAQRFPFGHNNLKIILVRPFIWYVGIYGQCHKCYCFVTLTFNFKVTGGLLKVRLWPFFHILAQYICPVSLQKFDLEALH